MPANEGKKKGLLPDDNTSDIEKSQADSNSEIREGQENSSILHDEYDAKSELPRDVSKPDMKSTSQEEFIEDKDAGKKQD